MIAPGTDCQICKDICDALQKKREEGRHEEGDISFWNLMTHVFQRGHKLEITINEYPTEEEKKRMPTSFLTT